MHYACSYAFLLPALYTIGIQTNYCKETRVPTHTVCLNYKENNRSGCCPCRPHDDHRHGRRSACEWAVLPGAGQEAKPSAMAQGRAVPVACTPSVASDGSGGRRTPDRRVLMRTLSYQTRCGEGASMNREGGPDCPSGRMGKRRRQRQLREWNGAALHARPRSRGGVRKGAPWSGRRNTGRGPQGSVPVNGPAGHDGVRLRPRHGRPLTQRAIHLRSDYAGPLLDFQRLRAW